MASPKLATMGALLLRDPAQEIEICELRPGEEDEWDQFVQSSPAGSFYHLTGWKTIVERILGHRCFTPAAVRRG